MSEQKEKTALELVERAITDICHGYNVSYNFMADIKSAIERERDAMLADNQRLQAAISQNQAAFDGTIQEMSARLKSSIVMRPISELPDRVPDGCVIVVVGKWRVTIKCWVWEPGADVFPHEGETHFYVLPLPKVERKLHPCYMPGCGGDGKCVYDYSGSEDRSRKSWFVDCLKCHAQGPRCDSEQEAEQAWGYAE